jgi:hypothetical protein
VNGSICMSFFIVQPSKYEEQRRSLPYRSLFLFVIQPIRSPPCLYHPDLSVGHRDEPFVDELVREWIPWLALHDVRLCLLVGHGDGGHHVRPQVNAEDGHRALGKVQTKKSTKREGIIRCF